MKPPTIFSGCMRSIPLLLVIAAISSCSTDKKGFSGSNSPLTAATPVVLKDPGAEALAKKKGDTPFTVSLAAGTTVNKREVWGVTYEQIFRIMIDDDNGGTPQYPTTVWSVSHNEGSRTYLSEIGLLIGRTNRGGWAWGLFRVSDDVPGVAQHVWQPEDQGSDGRMCVASFRIDGKPYVGGAYGTGSTRIFFRVPIDKSKPTKMDFTKLQKFPQGNGNWGYSCYMDQGRGIFYSTYLGQSIYGVNVKTGAVVASPPNATHTSTIADFTVLPSFAGSYSISGDENGNVLSAGSRVPGVADYQASYTWSQDAVSKYLFGSTWGDDKFYVTHPDCFSKLRDCAGKHFVFSGMKALGTIGPMSALGDGRVAAWSRSSYHSNQDGISYLYLVSLKDVNNPSLGLNFKKIFEAPGEAYMYTDFTGATLYAADVESTVELVKGADFRTGVPIRVVKMKWFAQSEKSEKWQGLTLKVRCYSKSDPKKPDYVPVEVVPEAGVEFELPGSCKGNIDSVDILTQAAKNAAGFSRAKLFEVFGVQNAESK